MEITDCIILINVQHVQKIDRSIPRTTHFPYTHQPINRMPWCMIFKGALVFNKILLLKLMRFVSLSRVTPHVCVIATYNCIPLYTHYTGLHHGNIIHRQSLEIHYCLPHIWCVCACVRVCVRACVRACVSSEHGRVNGVDNTWGATMVDGLLFRFHIIIRMLSTASPIHTRVCSYAHLL
jgi:hypothetical protein